MYFVLYNFKWNFQIIYIHEHTILDTCDNTYHVDLMAVIASIDIM